MAQEAGLFTVIHIVTSTIQTTWTTLATHPEVTIPGTLLLLGAMVAFGRKARVHG